MLPFIDLEALKIVSNCDGKYLTFMIANCINIKELSVGMHTGISDTVIMKALFYLKFDSKLLRSLLYLVLLTPT
jgi:hypothetical protein